MLYQQPDEISMGSDRPQTSSPEANSVEGPVSVHSDGPEANSFEGHVAVHGHGPEENHIEGLVVPADGPDANAVEEGPVVPADVPEANAVDGAVVPADDPEPNPVVPADGPDANAVDGQVAPVPPLDGDERTIFFFHNSATDAAFEGGDEDEMDVSEGWYEDDNTRTGSDIMSFDYTEAIPVIECVVGVMNPRVQCVGYVFGKHCHDYNTLGLQLLFCGRRAQLVGKYKIEFKQKGKESAEPADFTDAKEFAQLLEGIVVKPVRAEEPEDESDVIILCES